MHYHWRDTNLVILHNFDDKPHEVKLRLARLQATVLEDLMANKQSQADAQGTFHLTLDAYGYRWLRAGR